MTKRTETSPFKVGDRVRLQYGPRNVWGVIAEDSGVVGWERRHYYKVMIPQDPDEPAVTFRTPAEMELDRIGDDPITKADVIDYFNRGAYLWMIRKAQDYPGIEPSVWICRDVLGGMTFTFNPKFGMVGGVPVPSDVLDPRGRLRKDRREDVLKFLTGFGLTDDEARDVLAASKNGR